MKNKLLIIGAGGHGKVVADIALNMHKWDEICFLDDNPSLEFVLGIKVLGKSSEWIKYSDSFDIFVAIGSNETRKNLIEQLELQQVNMPKLIHPSAIVGRMVEIEYGTVIMAGVVINCCTKIGKGCIINTSSSIDHDCIVGNYVHMSPGVNISGNVTLEDSVWLGTGSKVINNIKLTESSIIGAGSVVIKSISACGTYVGVPTRRIK